MLFPICTAEKGKDRFKRFAKWNRLKSSMYATNGAIGMAHIKNILTILNLGTNPKNTLCAWKIIIRCFATADLLFDEIF